MNRSPRIFPLEHENPCKSKGSRVLGGDGGIRTHVVFPPSRTVVIPLFSRENDLLGVALLDPEDEALTRHRWHLSKRDYKWAYARSTIGGRFVLMHRMVMGLEPGDPRRVDHINGDRLDNRRRNLRIATDAQNAQNQGSRGGSSRYRGVTWDRSRGKWMATATLNGRRTTIGRFDSEDDANRAAVAWRAEHMPFSREAA